MNCEKEMNPPDLQRTVTNAVSRWPSSTWHRVSSHRWFLLSRRSRSPLSLRRKIPPMASDSLRSLMEFMASINETIAPRGGGLFVPSWHVLLWSERKKGKNKGESRQGLLIFSAHMLYDRSYPRDLIYWPVRWLWNKNRKYPSSSRLVLWTASFFDW